MQNQKLCILRELDQLKNFPWVSEIQTLNFKTLCFREEKNVVLFKYLVYITSHYQSVHLTLGMLGNREIKSSRSWTYFLLPHSAHEYLSTSYLSLLLVLCKLRNHVDRLPEMRLIYYIKSYRRKILRFYFVFNKTNRSWYILLYYPSISFLNSLAAAS